MTIVNTNEPNDLFDGLTNLNTGFDSPLIPHVSPQDFETVLDRCAASGTEFIDVEVFDADHVLLQVEIAPEDGLDWARKLGRKYAGQMA